MKRTACTEVEPIDVFHAHLDCCRRCREEPFNLCPIGQRTLVTATAETAARILTETKR